MFTVLMSLTFFSVYADESWTVYKTSDVFNYPYEINIPQIVISPTNEKYFVCRSMYKYNNKEWSKIVIDDYPKVSLYSLAFDDTTMWIGGDRHLFHYDGDTIIDGFNLYELFPEWRFGGLIRSVAVDDSGMVWMTFYYEPNSVDYGGIVSYGGKNFVNHTENLNSITQFYNIVIDHINHIWATSDKGVFFYDRKTWRLFNNENGLPFIVCGAIAVDHDNIVWIGLGTGGDSPHGLVSYDGETWTWYNSENSGLVDDRVVCIAVDHNNVKWIGTLSSGVSRFDGKTWKTFTSKNSGLPDVTPKGYRYSFGDPVYSIGIEKNNTIWFGMFNYIAKYTGEVLITSVNENATNPKIFPVIRSFPNPFNPSTTIEFTLPETGSTSLVIYNISGQRVSVLVSGNMTAGHHTAVWDGKDDSGSSVSAGIYFARLTCGGRTVTGKMVMMK